MRKTGSHFFASWTIGRVLGVLFGLFALVCLFATYDFSRGRVPDTESKLVLDVLAASKSRECGRDATEIVARYLPNGMAQGDVERVLSETLVRSPDAWFWKPVNENSTDWDGDSLEALRTIKTTAFGNELLRIYAGFADGKLNKLAAEVVCRFE